MLALSAQSVKPTLESAPWRPPENFEEFLEDLNKEDVLEWNRQQRKDNLKPHMIWFKRLHFSNIRNRHGSVKDPLLKNLVWVWL